MVLFPKSSVSPILCLALLSGFFSLNIKAVAGQRSPLSPLGDREPLILSQDLPEESIDPALAAQFQANAESFVDYLFAANYDQAWEYLGPVTQSENPPRVLMRKNRAFLKRVGDFQRRLDSRVNGNVVAVSLEFAKVTDSMILIFDENAKIIGIDFPRAE
ncbi:DUF3887 domain-containing protein [Candidatus Synechococcus calcipolaris G9]|uniref:DUF3887 domain-containing protein n=1 Tax=Candidatus Synechococcus calcipolaris G9 TaxID=1497997 RepID=A0ABT6F091_9SYNE|nr:hypothetical protein [Candidatus Synechococcus calcipolaris]MDG2991198.1 DUF3887 domain-containing protein [Candidatus Synechococcus calcipolaris G9]